MFSSVDIALLEWINQHRIGPMDEVLRWFSSITTYVSLGVIIIAGILSLFRRVIWKKTIQLAVVLFIAGVVSFSIKSMVSRERPFRVVKTIEKLSTGGGYSFPSGHTVEAFAMATAISMMFRKRWIQLSVFLWAILVGYSRIALGVHYPTDVLAGIIVGIGVAVGIDFIFRRFINQSYIQT